MAVARWIPAVAAGVSPGKGWDAAITGNDADAIDALSVTLSNIQLSWEWYKDSQIEIIKERIMATWKKKIIWEKIWNVNYSNTSINFSQFLPLTGSDPMNAVLWDKYFNQPFNIKHQ